MYTQESLLDLVDLIYAAAYEPRRWNEVLEALQRLVGAAGADVCFFDFNASSFNFSHSVGLVIAGCVGRGAEVRVPVSGVEEAEIRVFTFSNNLSSFPVSVTVGTIFEPS